MAGHRRLKSQHLVAFAEAALSRWKLISFATVLAGAMTYGAVWLQPRYTSYALLSMDESHARFAESIMRSAAATETVLTRFSDVGRTLEERKRYLEKYLTMKFVGSGRTPTLYEMQLTHRNPATARQMASDLIDRWLEFTKPGPAKKTELEADLARDEAMADELTSLIGRLKGESESLVYPNNLQGEIATPIHDLMEKREEAYKVIAKTKAQLEGTPRDVVLVPPSLPAERNSSAGVAALKLACMVLLAMLAFTEFHNVLLPKWRQNLATFRAGRSQDDPHERIGPATSNT
jgi:hypothetical protein